MSINEGFKEGDIVYHKEDKNMHMVVIANGHYETMCRWVEDRHECCKMFQTDELVEVTKKGKK
jgi:uncharacterized protein YodC (DUF2158 family)